VTTAENFAVWSGLDPAALLDSDWVYFEHEEGGQVAAIAAVNGFEIHFAVNPSWRGRLLFRERIRNFMRPLFEDRGFLTTRIVCDEDKLKNARFVERLGFKHTHTENGVAHFMLSELPYSRGD